MSKESGQMFAEVWFSPETRIKSRTKCIVYEDCGSLNVDHESITFKGRSQTFSLFGPFAISRESQSINWVTYIVVNVFSVPLTILVARAFFAKFDFDPTWHVVFLYLAINILGLTLGKCTSWIKIRGRSSGDEVVSCYFADGTAKGWKGIFGGTAQLHDAIFHLTISSQLVRPSDVGPLERKEAIPSRN